ncbi:peptidoglycan-binding domain-containing protein [Streptomyces cyaneofuscatus]|uniref:peptidoglycan-binding domain-containing protein n=1 Tax=Streptomyces cyaneofuscatus TaxID=66883 RepID=UPI0033D4023B
MTTGLEDAPTSTRPSVTPGDHTLALHPVRHSQAASQPRDAPPGIRRTVNRRRTAMAVGAVAMLAAAAAATTLTGRPLGPGGTAQSAVPVMTSAPPSNTAPAVTPVPPPAGRQLSPVDGDGPVPRTTTPTPSPPTSPHPPTPAPSSTRPAPPPAGGGTSRCTGPHLPGTPCRPGTEPGTASPSRAPVGLCCAASGPEVTDLQYRLQFLDLYTAEADGVYNPGVADSVAAYQRLRHITTDPSGQYGPATKAALQREVPELIDYY